MPKITLQAPDIGCEHCAMKIKKALSTLAVSNVQVDIPAKKVTFDYPDDTVLEEAKAALERIGYPVQE